MTRRSYDQYCGLAHALDVVGERWTLLIVRELMTGPKRYSDLAAALDGIGTSLLAARLKQLESDGLVARDRLVPPAASVVYQLTPAGDSLGDAIIPLALWGARNVVPESPGEDRIKAEWMLLAFTKLVDRQALVGLDAVYDIHVGETSAQLIVSEGDATIRPAGTHRPADAKVTINSETLMAIVAGRITLDEALGSGAIAIDGDLDKALRLAAAGASVL